MDSIAGELTRKYNLNDRQQEALKDWLDEQAEAQSRQITDLLDSEESGFVDFSLAMNEGLDGRSRREAIDAFMEKTLEPDALAEYERERMTRAVERVQNEAEGRVQRLDRLVELDEEQKDQAFAILAQGSEYFDSSMQFEGLANDFAIVMDG